MTVVIVPMAIEQSQLRATLQNYIDSGCNMTGTSIYQAHESTSKKINYSFNQSLLGTIHSHSYTYNTNIRSLKTLPIILSIDNFTEKIEKKVMLASLQPFFTFMGGYLMYMSVYPAGYDRGQDSHLSVFLHLIKGPYDDELQKSGKWPLRGTFTIEILGDDQDYGYLLPMHYQRCELCTSQVIKDKEAPLGWGYSHFMPHDILLHQNKSNYLINDTLSFQLSFNINSDMDIAVLWRKLRFMLFILICYLIKVLGVHFWPMVFNFICTFDVNHFKTLTLLPSIIIDALKSLFLVEVLLSADVILVLMSYYLSIDDSISYTLHCILLRLYVVSLYFNVGTALVLYIDKEESFLVEFNPLWLSEINTHCFINYNTSRYIYLTLEPSSMAKGIYELFYFGYCVLYAIVIELFEL